jgi:trans-aconitate methyltransferase
MSLENQWFWPKNLERQNKAARQAAPGDGLSGDWASYAQANRGDGLAGSEIEKHNVVDPRARVEMYRRALAPAQIVSIADLGCGLGFTADALSKVFRTESVTGYEISDDACEFAAQRFPNLRFIPGAVLPGEPLFASYDLILCQEFYPFTRTADLEFHKLFIDGLLASLTARGVLLITLTSKDPENSILANIGRLEQGLQRKGIRLTLTSLPHERVYRYLPSYRIARLLTDALCRMTGKAVFKAVMISRQR